VCTESFRHYRPTYLPSWLLLVVVASIQRVPLLVVGHALWDLSNAPALVKLVIIGIDATLWRPTLVPATDPLGLLNGLIVAAVSMFKMPGAAIVFSRHGSW